MLFYSGLYVPHLFEKSLKNKTISTLLFCISDLKIFFKYKGKPYIVFLCLKCFVFVLFFFTLCPCSCPCPLVCGFKNYLALLYTNVLFLFFFTLCFCLCPLFCGFEIYLALLYTCTGYTKTTVQTLSMQH